MAKPKSSGSPATSDKTADQAAAASWSRTLRETVESIVIAFVLAFLFRTFEAEAFVIPTGSMAPTLQGRHKDLDCPKCGYHYRVNASEEESEGRRLRCDVIEATCPMCRYTITDATQYPSYSGDRIIVSKLAYDLAEPERWDVVVFKFPEEAKMNYIKRLVGLPNENIQIRHGDIYTAPRQSEDDADFQIARKPPDKLRAMLQPVYDNDYVLADMIAAGLLPRWQPWHAEQEPAAWQVSEDYKSFKTAGDRAERAWLRYQNIVPDSETWRQFERGRIIEVPKPQLITDFYAYNDGKSRGPDCERLGNPRSQTPWVGDLAVEGQFDIANSQGTIVLELVKGGVTFRCYIDVATGKATLAIDALPQFNPVAQTAMVGPGSFDVLFANVDEQLHLWINGKVVEFDQPTTYPSLNNYQPVVSRPQPGTETPTDLSPVGIAAEGGVALEVRDLNVWRDIYYLAEPSQPRGETDESMTFPLDEDQFFVLGDNSPRSADGRYWHLQRYVDRNLMIGKALYVYWPHSYEYIEIGGKRIPFPFWPNFKQMRFVH